MEIEKTYTPTPEIKATMVRVIELSFDIYSKLLRHSNCNQQTIKQTVRKLIEEGCK